VSILSVPCQWVLTAPRSGYYQQTLNPKYNIAKEPGAPMYGRKHSEKTKQIWSEARTGENNPMYGQNHSEETK
jgi:hypothetical protein